MLSNCFGRLKTQRERSSSFSSFFSSLLEFVRIDVNVFVVRRNALIRLFFDFHLFLFEQTELMEFFFFAFDDRIHCRDARFAAKSQTFSFVFDSSNKTKRKPFRSFTFRSVRNRKFLFRFVLSVGNRRRNGFTVFAANSFVELRSRRKKTVRFLDLFSFSYFSNFERRIRQNRDRIATKIQRPNRSAE